MTMPANDQMDYYDARADELMEQPPFCGLHYGNAKTEDAIMSLIATALRSAHAAGKAEGREEVKELVSELECCYQSLCPCSKDAVDKARSLPQPAPAKGESHK
jgi:hypothetical protein